MKHRFPEMASRQLPTQAAARDKADPATTSALPVIQGLRRAEARR
jgi:hypothetical protein